MISTKSKLQKLNEDIAEIQKLKKLNQALVKKKERLTSKMAACKKRGITSEELTLFENEFAKIEAGGVVIGEKLASLELRFGKPRVLH